MSVTIRTRNAPTTSGHTFMLLDCGRKRVVRPGMVNVQIKQESPNMRPLAVSPPAAALLCHPVHDMAR